MSLKPQAKVRESSIETYLVKRVAECGGVAFKWASPSHRGVPDRIIFLRGRCVLVEVKAPGKKPTPLQSHTHTRLARHGFPVEVVDTHNAVDNLLMTLEAAP